MAGIYGIMLKANKEKAIYKRFFNYKQPNILTSETSTEAYTFGRCVLNKLTDDRFFYEDEFFIACLEGVHYAKDRGAEHLIKAYQTQGEKFVERIKGIFSGFIFDKSKQKLLVFTDPLATKAIFYYHGEQGFAFSSEMHVLSKVLRENKISINPDYDGIYSLALFGQMFNDFTLVNEIKRLSYGSILSYDLKKNKINRTKYHQFKQEVVHRGLPEIIEELNHKVEHVIDEIWGKDTQYGYSEHLSLVSGGMDARTNLMIAKKRGFEKINGYTYGNVKSSDVKIASQIAKDHCYAHMQFNLHHGNFFSENILENYIKPIDGLTHFTASAIIYNAYSRINLAPFGQIHSGQIGGMITGGNVYPDFDFKNNTGKLGLNGFIMDKDLTKKLTFLDDLVARYQGSDFEIFSFEQRLANGTLTGDKIISNFIDQAAIAFDLDLLKYVLSIPQKYKVNQRLYYTWLKAKHPEVLNYTWENIGLKPNSNFNINYGRLIKKYVNGGKKYFKLNYDSMNPITTWFKQNPKVLDEFDAIFERNLQYIEDQELKADLKAIYQEDIFEYRNKFAVITVILAIKLHFYS